MIHTRTTDKSVHEVAESLVAKVSDFKFGHLYTHDLRAKMDEKGVAFDRECLVLEICNPQHAKTILDTDMHVSMALPCRISVYEENGKTVVGTLLPTQLVGVFSDDATMQETARIVERGMLDLIEAVL
jgi:uncharacterized protein (DUF302 family)